MTDEQNRELYHQRLAELEAKLRDAHPQENEENSQIAADAGRAFASQAMRLGVEMLAAVAVSVGIGVLVDRGLESKPWGVVVFFFLGVAAGGLNVYRAVKGLGYGPIHDRDEEVKPPKV